jgi:crossover junction endodeoxyribonuclease RuvC
VLGIDPGLSGAAVVIENGQVVAVTDLPTVGDGTKRALDEHALHRWLGAHHADHAFIEQVSAMLGWGVGATFRFGMAYGAIRAVIALHGIPYTLVSPVKWKKFYSLTGQEKEASRQRALQLFPQGAAFFARKMDHQRADAALVANYGLSSMGSEPRAKRNASNPRPGFSVATAGVARKSYGDID